MPIKWQWTKSFEVQSQHFGHGPRVLIWTDFKMSFSSAGSFAFPPIINFDKPAALIFKIWAKFLAKKCQKSCFFAEIEIRKTINVQSNRWNKFENTPWFRKTKTETLSQTLGRRLLIVLVIIILIYLEYVNFKRMWTFQIHADPPPLRNKIVHFEFENLIVHKGQLFETMISKWFQNAKWFLSNFILKFLILY